MAVPKKRKSHSRTGTHRSHNALVAGHGVNCPQCNDPMKLHNVCPHCGFYRGREVIKKQQD